MVLCRHELLPLYQVGNTPPTPGVLSAEFIRRLAGKHLFLPLCGLRHGGGGNNGRGMLLGRKCSGAYNSILMTTDYYLFLEICGVPQKKGHVFLDTIFLLYSTSSPISSSNSMSSFLWPLGCYTHCLVDQCFGILLRSVVSPGLSFRARPISFLRKTCFPCHFKKRDSTLGSTLKPDVPDSCQCRAICHHVFPHV